MPNTESLHSSKNSPPTLKRRRPLWLILTLLSGAASLAIVRLATPSTPDDPLLIAVLFLFLPGLLLGLLSIWRRALAIAVAAVLPLLWCLLSCEAADGIGVWLGSLLGGTLIVWAAVAWRRRRSGLAIVIAGLVLVLGALPWIVPQRAPNGPRVLLLGIDGASWPLIDRLLASGEMPQFAELMEGGHRANLRSLPKMISPRVWSTICTGSHPEEHGIWDFNHRKSDFRVGTLWDQMRREGRSFGLCEWYFTWPPDPGQADVDFIVPSQIAPDTQTFPPDYSFYRLIVQEARQQEQGRSQVSNWVYLATAISAWRHGIRLSTLRSAAWEAARRILGHRSSRDRVWMNRKVSTALEADLLTELIRTRRPEFVAALFTQVDATCHRYWKYLEPESFADVTPADQERYGGVIDAVYREMDRSIGKILGVLPAETNILVVSDHGFQAASEKVANWFCRIRTLRLLTVLDVSDRVSGTNVDLDVYLRPTVRSVAEREELLARLATTLRAARLVGDEEPLFTVERDAETLYLALMPKLFVPDDPRILLNGREYPYQELIRARPQAFWSGKHHPDGVYLLAGPAAERARRADSLHVVDVAPTLAALLDLPVCPRWPGRPALTDLSLDNVRLADYARPDMPEAESQGMSDDLREKLRSLGYLE